MTSRGDVEICGEGERLRRNCGRFVGTGLADGTRIPAQQADTRHSFVLARAAYRSPVSAEQGLRRTVLCNLRRTRGPAAGPTREERDSPDCAPWRRPDRSFQHRPAGGTEPMARSPRGRASSSSRQCLSGRPGQGSAPMAEKTRGRPGVRGGVPFRAAAGNRSVGPGDAPRCAPNRALPSERGRRAGRMDAHPEAFVVETTAPIEREMHEGGRVWVRGFPFLPSSEGGAEARAPRTGEVENGGHATLRPLRAAAARPR